MCLARKNPFSLPPHGVIFFLLWRRSFFCIPAKHSVFGFASSNKNLSLKPLHFFLQNDESPQ